MDAHTLYSGYKERNISVRLNEAEYQQLLGIREQMRRNSRASNSDAIRYALRAIYETEAEPAAQEGVKPKRKRGRGVQTDARTGLAGAKNTVEGAE